MRSPPPCANLHSEPWFGWFPSGPCVIRAVEVPHLVRGFVVLATKILTDAALVDDVSGAVEVAPMAAPEEPALTHLTVDVRAIVSVSLRTC